MKLKYLIGLAAFPCFQLSAAQLPEPFDESDAMAVDPVNDDTHFVMGYAIWYNDSAWYSFDNSNNHNPTLKNLWSGTQYYDLQNGETPSTVANLFGSQPKMSFITGEGYDENGGNPPSSGEGYYSYDVGVIEYHARLLSELGIDIVATDMTNVVDQLFPSDSLPSYTNPNNPLLLSFARVLSTLDNVDASYNLKVIPVIGAQYEGQSEQISVPSNEDPHEYLPQPNDLEVQSGSHYSPFQRALAWVVNQLRQHPDRAVLYPNDEGVLAPLVMVYNGAHYPETLFDDVQDQMAELESASEGGQDFTALGPDFVTLRSTVGFPEAQRGAGENWHSTDHHPSVTAPYVRAKDRIWNWTTRLYCGRTDGWSVFTMTPGGTPGTDRAEWVSVAHTSRAETPSSTPFLPARQGAIINQQMTLARRTNFPVFVFFNQFNFYVSHDSGFLADTTADIEPTDEWDTVVYDRVQDAIDMYEVYEGGGGVGRFTDLSFRALEGGGHETQIAAFTMSGIAGQRVVIKTIGRSLADLTGWNDSTVGDDPSITLYGPGGWIATSDDWDDNTTLANEGTGISAPSTGNAALLINSSEYLSQLNYGQGPMEQEEAAITADLNPGAFTLFLNDNGANGRIMHTRIMVSDEISDTRVTNFAIRSRVESGNRITIAAFRLDRQMTIGLRGSGPSMDIFGIPENQLLEDPEILVFNGSGSIIAQSADIDSTTLSQLQPHYGGWTIHEDEAGLKLTLQPGNYSVHLRSQAGSGTDYGIGHLDIFEW